jgi:hypothetical protein
MARPYGKNREICKLKYLRTPPLGVQSIGVDMPPTIRTV